MLDALQAGAGRGGRRRRPRAVVLGANGKAFCPGHNLKEMLAVPELAYYQALFARCSRMMLSIQNLPVPVIARVQGIATAAGCQLVAQCDLAVASTEARFAVSGVNFGLFCSTPSVPLLRNVPAKQAMEMLLTGDFISAAAGPGARAGQPRGGRRTGRRSWNALVDQHPGQAARGHGHGQGAVLPPAGNGHPRRPTSSPARPWP
jgi:hypothetical protein